MTNRYLYCSRISEAKFREVVRLFSLDIEATKIAKISKLNRNTVNGILRLIRIRLAEYCEEQSPYSGVVEVDESYFGAPRVKGKCGRGAYGKTIVFGIFKRNGHVYTEIVSDCSKATLQAVIIRGRCRSIVSLISMDGVDIMGWLTSAMKSICALSMELMNSCAASPISMASKDFGTLQKCAWQSSEV